ncbi:hypothetical protein HK100_003259 [Physocladia obscura]|uniref:Transcription factor domain-containing protein n=1 Tax=Physocladia obscura TaxID=109957 RepID=A0AAD5T7M4_9FUNG|nr:hypothetical protein HK100_003259 [Physocladia obscura]
MACVYDFDDNTNAPNSSIYAETHSASTKNANDNDNSRNSNVDTIRAAADAEINQIPQLAIDVLGSASASVSSVSTLLSSASLLDRLVNAAVRPLADDDADNHKDDCDPPNYSLRGKLCLWNDAVEDPDMLPTMSDWAVLQHFVTTQPLLFRTSYSILDPLKIVEHFFQEPPELRLPYCAVAAHFQRPPLPPAKCFEYYERAKRAIIRQDTPTLKRVQGLHLITTFAYLNGQPAIALPLFHTAIRMIIYLKLDVDPDDSPWLASQNLSEYDKDCRRRAFWMFNCSSKIVRIGVGEAAMPYKLVPRGVKPMHFDVGKPAGLPLIPENVSPIVYLCPLLDLIQAIASESKKVPEAASNIFASPAFDNLEVELSTWAAMIPPSFRMTPQNLSRHLKSAERSGLMNLNLFHKTAICILHRQRFYLTAYMPLHSPIMTCENLNIILRSLNASMHCALEISRLNTSLFQTSRFDANAAEVQGPEQVILTPVYWKECVHMFFSLFEAAIVLWFFQCNTKRHWWSAFCLESKEREIALETEIRDAMDDILKSLTLLEALASGNEFKATGVSWSENNITDGIRPKRNMVTPMVNCVAAMIEEIDAKQAHKVEKVQNQAGLESVVLEMEILALGTVMTNLKQQKTDKHDPWIILGLLGAEVNGSFKLRAKNEEAWRLFWGHVEQI